jgi:hypothetical protein
MLANVTDVGADGKKLEPSYIADGNVKWCHPLWNSLAVPQILNTELPYDQQFQTPRCTPKRTENVCLHKTPIYTNVYRAKKWK